MKHGDRVTQISTGIPGMILHNTGLGRNRWPWRFYADGRYSNGYAVPESEIRPLIGSLP